MTRRVLQILAGPLLAVLFVPVGCSPTLTTIPIGHWEGRGTYIDYEVVVPKDGSREVVTLSNTRSYETFLTIKEMRAFGRPAVSVAIRSMRGQLMNVPGNTTTSEFLLVEVKRLSEGTVLYARFSGGVSQNADNNDKALLKLAASAALIPYAGGAVLQVGYDQLDDKYFMDTFTFSNDKVSKAGSLRWATASDANETKIVEVFWSEQLSEVGSP